MRRIVMWIRIFALAVFLLCNLASARLAGAVTDCSKPATKIDWLLCSNERAAVEEQRMALSFRAAMKRIENREALLKEQKDWTANVRDACNDVPCLMKAYRERATELDTY